MIRHHEYMKFGQIGFPQRWIMTRTDNPKQCMKEQASKGESVFYCFGPYKHLVGGFDMKSMHLGHKCVATDFHQSCTHPGARNINCICQTYNQNYGCNVVHFSSKMERYVKDPTEEDLKSISQNKNEIDIMTQKLSGRKRSKKIVKDEKKSSRKSVKVS